MQIKNILGVLRNNFSWILISFFCLQIIFFTSVFSHINNSYNPVKIQSTPMINLTIDIGNFINNTWQSREKISLFNISCKNIKKLDQVINLNNSILSRKQQSLGITDYNDFVSTVFFKKTNQSAPTDLRYCQKAHILNNNWDQVCYPDFDSKVIKADLENTDNFECYTLGKGFLGNNNLVNIYQYRIYSQDYKQTNLKSKLANYSKEYNNTKTNPSYSQLILVNNLVLYRENDKYIWQNLNKESFWNIYFI